jgi:hypothetical protein
VLFINPWGLEEMCSRRFFRVTAEHFADLGVPSLRFDYPGAGDALDLAGDPVGLAIWEDAIRTAAERLKSLSGCSHIVIVAQGLGAALAQRTASSIAGVDAIAMLGPVVNGRAYLRELSAWSKFINYHLGLGEHRRARGQACDCRAGNARRHRCRALEAQDRRARCPAALAISFWNVPSAPTTRRSPTISGRWAPRSISGRSRATTRWFPIPCFPDADGDRSGADRMGGCATVVDPAATRSVTSIDAHRSSATGSRKCRCGSASSIIWSASSAGRSAQAKRQCRAVPVDGL